MATQTHLPNRAHNQLTHNIRLLQRCAQFCGNGIFKPPYRQSGLNFRICQAAIGVYLLLTAYTMFHFRANLGRLMQAMCINAIWAIGVHKLSVSMQFSKDFMRPIDMLFAIYASNPDCAGDGVAERRGRRRQSLLCTTSAETTRMTRFMIGSVVCGVTIFAVWPTYALAVRGEYELLMCVICPGIDYTQAHGWLATSVFHVAFAWYGVNGNLCFDLFVQVVVCSHRSLVGLLDDSLQELGEMWAADADGGCSAAEARRRRIFLRNILLAFRETDRYIQMLIDLFRSVIMSEVTMLSLTILMSLFCITVDKWIGGVGVLIFALVLLLSMSCLGTILQNSNKELCDIIYGSSWYLFPLADQRELLMILMKTQRSSELWIGPMAPLNVESALKILKTIYQMFMMMLEFV